jgi:putative oxidoreductase
MIKNRYLLFVFSLMVGGIFIWAGLLKIFDPLGFAQAIANYRVFPHWMSFMLALVLPWMEVICGAFLVLGLFRRSSALFLSFFLAGFLILVVSTIVRGIDIDCGCFGRFSQKVDYKLLLTDGILLFFSLNIFFQKKTEERKGLTRRT